MKIAGWIMTALAALFLLGASALPKFLGMDAALESLQVVGWPAEYLLLIGVIEVACVALLVFPRTALLGTVFTTALLGAALAANLRVDNPLFSHTLFSVYLGIWIWIALWLREPKVRTVFPVTSSK